MNATIVDPSEVLCPSNECVYRRGLVALYIDGGHFGDELAESMRPLLLRALLDGNSKLGSRPSPGSSIAKGEAKR